MKKLLVLGAFCLMLFSVNAQSYLGFLSDNYKGVHGVISNPASIADSRFKTEINLIGVSALAGNDYFGVNFNDLFDENFDVDEDATTFPKDNNNAFLNTDVLGPSFMFNINEKISMAVFSRGRVFFNLNEVGAEGIEQLIDDLDANNSVVFNEGDFYGTANAWAEIGITYAQVVMNKEQHFLKGGLSLKYLMGFGNAYGAGNNVSVDFDADAIVAGNGTVTTTGEATYGYSENLEDLDNIESGPVDGATGIGVDLGFEYEWRPDFKEYTSTDRDGNKYMPRDINKYKLKLGLSLTDLGSISYPGVTERYDINNTLSQSDFEDIEIDQLDNLYTVLASTDLEKTVLPTALHFNADWNINQKFYLNLNTDFSLIAKDKENANRIANLVALTPRFESKWFSFYLPLSMMQHSGFQVGAGLRAGPLYIGSGSVLSLLVNDESKAADFYAGLKVPIYHSVPKDKDGDGVLDKVDQCPEVKGPELNYGCPYPDTDEDGVLDKDDECPQEPGEVDNNGCPWLDTDADGLLDKDDGCPIQAGPRENNGCPWPDTDLDGVLDKDDNCVDVPGTVANNGCPEVTEEVQKTLNAYAKTILFDTGKSSIKEESNNVLNDIVNILKEYPTAKFTVEGHTDSVGRASGNQRLSDSRANAVKNYLVDNGIDPFRLSAIGYGEDRPIASNKTKTGRAKNRRVEINLVKE